MSLFVKISSLSAGSNEIEFSFKPEEVGLQSPFFGSTNIKMDIQKSHHQLVVNAVLSVQYGAECDRCGRKIDLQPVSDFNFVYLFENKENEKDDFNVRYITPETDKIDISQEVYDYALLSIPLKILCSEDCKGLCRYCGINKNSGECDCTEEEKGPLWDSIQELKKKLKNN